MLIHTCCNAHVEVRRLWGCQLLLTMWVWGTLIQVSRLGSKCRNISLAFPRFPESAEDWLRSPQKGCPPTPPHPDLLLQAGNLSFILFITLSPHPHLPLPPPSQYLQLPQCLAGWAVTFSLHFPCGWTSLANLLGSTAPWCWSSSPH